MKILIDGSMAIEAKKVTLGPEVKLVIYNLSDPADGHPIVAVTLEPDEAGALGAALTRLSQK